MYSTIDDKSLARDTFGAAELDDLISDILNRSVVLKQRTLAHGIDTSLRPAP